VNLVQSATLPYGTPAPDWVGSRDECDRAIETIRGYEIAGLDTEFDGVDIGEESCVGKANLHVLSVAIPSGPLLPRGFNAATAFVFSRACLGFDSLRDWIQDDRRAKAVHNQPVDAHSIRNAGAKLAGGRNTLAMARWWWPERAKRAGFGLDALGLDFCGAGKTEDFDELLGYDDHEYRPTVVSRKRCECGVLGCRKKKAGADGQAHEIKTAEEVLVQMKHKVRCHIPLASLDPGHTLWPRYLNYAAWDAVLALWLYQLMMRDGRRERPYPWTIQI
jgi:hypothetical protein